MKKKQNKNSKAKDLPTHAYTRTLCSAHSDFHLFHSSIALLHLLLVFFVLITREKEGMGGG